MWDDNACREFEKFVEKLIQTVLPILTGIGFGCS